MNGGPSVAWASAALAVGHMLNAKPLPAGLSHAVVGDWEIWLNNGKDEQAVPGHDMPLGAFGICASNRVYVAVVVLDPRGGMIGGYSEDQFIADMETAIPEADRLT